MAHWQSIFNCIAPFNTEANCFTLTYTHQLTLKQKTGHLKEKNNEMKNDLRGQIQPCKILVNHLVVCVMIKVMITYKIQMKSIYLTSHLSHKIKLSHMMIRGLERQCDA